jgi:2-dehydropantoate 2-reductase
MKWLKLFVNFNNCIPALIGKSMQETFADMDFCKLSILLLWEGIHIVQKAGIKLVSLPQFPVERILAFDAMRIDQAATIINQTLTKLSREPLYGSILQSIMRKRASEIDFINGEVMSLAKNLGLNAPLNQKIVDLVHQVEETGQFFSKEQIIKEALPAARESGLISYDVEPGPVWKTSKPSAN